MPRPATLWSRPAAVRGILAALVLAAAGLVPAFADAIQEGQMVSFDVRGEKIQGYFVRPQKPGLYPGVVVIHEWWGLNDQIKGVADRFADKGYAVIAPDLYRGKIPADAGYAHEMMRGLDENWAVDVVGAAAGELRTLETQYARRPRGEKEPVGTVGFGMGGRISLATGLKQKDVQAIVMFYGRVETDKKELELLKVPLFGAFGDEDRGTPVDQVKAFQSALKDAGKDAAIQIYHQAGQSFFNEMRPSYDQESARDAWYRTLEFFEKSLKPVKASPVPPSQQQPEDPNQKD